MPRKFIFGVPNYFDFTFQAGHKSPASSLPDGTVSSPCGTLNKLPLEVRTIIYIKCLKTERNIKQAHTFLGRQPPIAAEDCTHIEAIDAALLRTCRAIYSEAIRILYGMNRFYFRIPRDVKQFAHLGLGNTPFGFYRTASKPSSAVSNAPYGRLTMIRFLSLKLSSVNNEHDWKKIWSLWSDFFYPPEEQDQSVGFPALVWLALDFKEWELGGGDGSKLRVKPFLQKLRPTGGLRHLTLIGVKHKQNIRDFKHGFVREGGTFRPASSTVKTVETTTVTHDDLPEVSMCVRAIVEKDRASRV